jgi:hypothetical protein
MELILPLPNTPSWRGAQLKAQGLLYLFNFTGEKFSRRILLHGITQLVS